MSNPQPLIPKTFASVPHITIHNHKSYSSQNPHYKSSKENIKPIHIIQIKHEETKND